MAPSVMEGVEVTKCGVRVSPRERERAPLCAWRHGRQTYRLERALWRHGTGGGKEVRLPGSRWRWVIGTQPLRDRRAAPGKVTHFGRPPRVDAGGREDTGPQDPKGRKLAGAKAFL